MLQLVALHLGHMGNTNWTQWVEDEEDVTIKFRGGCGGPGGVGRGVMEFKCDLNALGLCVEIAREKKKIN